MLTSRSETAESAPHQLRITEVRRVASPGASQLQVALAHWLVAVVQTPPGPAPVLEAFAVGASWPPAAWPVGCTLLGYLDARDATLF